MMTSVGLSYLVRGPVDDAELSALHHRAFAGDEPEETTPWAARLAAHSVAWICAYDDGILVGFVHACGDGGRHAFLLDTVVEPSLQGRGVGRELVRRLIAAVREAGCEWLHVDYEPHLDGFYRGCGFSPTSAGLVRLR